MFEHTDLFASDPGEQIPVERQAVDLVTFLDILDAREIRLPLARLAPIVAAALRVEERLGLPDATQQIQTSLSRILD